MHLDDGLGQEPGLHCVYNHHEQACAIAAESYARIHNRIAAVCVQRMLILHQINAVPASHNWNASLSATRRNT